jgi:hypothetical protein
VDVSEELLDYCRSVEQEQAVKQVIEHGGIRPAAEAEGRNRNSLQRIIKRVKEQAALKGVAPETDLNNPTAPGFNISKVSSFYNRFGRLAGRWVQQKPEDITNEQIIEGLLAGCSKPIHHVAPTPVPQNTLDDLLSTYILTDFHMGMLTLEGEVGAQWDMETAVQVLYSWLARTIAVPPRAKTAVLAQLGDFLDFDSWDSVTPASGHVLDVATRFPELAEAAAEAIIRVIKRLLEHHEIVHVLMMEGNHDPASSVWLKVLLKRVFADEPRVIVDMEMLPFACLTHGDISLFFHHGHKLKPEQAAEKIAAVFRDKMFGTKRSYLHMGHLHNHKILTTPLMKVEQHNTLSPSNAYAARLALVDDRTAMSITYDKSREINRSTVPALAA